MSPRTLLLRLPVEIRLKIYHDVFSSVSLTFMEPNSPAPETDLSQTPNALSLLLACQQIHSETKHVWLNRVSFEFHNLEIMMNTFSKLPDSILSQIRHVLLAKASILILPTSDLPYGRLFTLASIFKLLPTMSLDVLTAIGMSDGEDSYLTLNDLVKYGTGWKELRFATAQSSMLGFENGEQSQSWVQRMPQPGAWKEEILCRDGVETGPSVEIYRSTEANGGIAAVLGTATRRTFEQAEPYDVTLFGKEEDSQLMAEGEKEKGLLVVVRRGKGVNFAQDGGAPYESHDVRSIPGGVTWSDLKDKCIDYL
ncbi:hypothetical protein BKA61DRAFT_579501 [Leptodontidium sp. MPI-SDFR-AT-0119]|nr:hypothetical protein BKA61DRAFT_579501 [Leptodontidium sp. MPI-SDFR-AT-0119]